MLNRETHNLIVTLYESREDHFSKKILLNPNRWRHTLSLQEIKALNDAYAKFVFAEPMIILESNGIIQDRAKLWEQFLELEDELIYEAPADDRLAAAMAEEEPGEKKQGFLSRAWGAVKKAAKAPLKVVAGTRSLSRMGKAGKAREAEFEEMKDAENEISDLIRAMNSNVDNFEVYPNNKSDKEFQEQTLRTLLLADKMIEAEKDSGIRAAMIDAAKKWISYVLDQKLGDFYKHFKEVSVTLGNLLYEEEEANKKKSALSTRSGESETLKGLKSNLAPAILGALGAAGFAAAGILKAHPDLLGSDSVEVISQGSPSQVEELVTQKLGNLKVTDWSAKGSASQVYEHMFGSKPQSSEDFMKLFKTFDPDGADPHAGAKNFFDTVGISNKGAKNSEFVLDRLTKMNPDKAFDMPGVGQMERMGGRAGVGKIVTGLIVRQLKKKAVSGVMTKVMASAGISTVGAAATGAALAIGAGGVLSALAVKMLRVKGMKDSRAAFLDNLIDAVGSKVRDAEASAASDENATRIDVNVDIDSGKVEVTPPNPNKQDQPSDEEEDEEAADQKCSDEEIKAKLMDVLKVVKFKKGGTKVVEKMMKALSSESPSSLEDLKKILNKGRVKPLKDATVAKFADAIADCFDLEGEDEEVEETGGSGGAAGVTDDDVARAAENVKDAANKALAIPSMADGDKIRKVVYDMLQQTPYIRNDLSNAEQVEVQNALETYVKDLLKNRNKWNLNSVDALKTRINQDLGRAGSRFGPLSRDAARVAKILAKEIFSIDVPQKNPNEETVGESRLSAGKNDQILLERWQKMAGLST